jgi:hypothetical protein
MADERYQGDETMLSHSELHLRENRAGAEPLPAGHALPGGAPRVARTTGTGDPEVVRTEIEQTRARMSETIDEIEETLARKRDRLQERLDFLAPVRERPLMAAGAAFTVGLLFGLITGGDEEEDEPDFRLSGGGGLRFSSGDGDDGEAWKNRSALWENRARRLLRVAREQEQEIHDLQERYGSLYSRDMELRGFEDDEADEALHSSASGFRDTVLHGLTGAITNAFRGMGRSH